MQNSAKSVRLRLQNPQRVGMCLAVVNANGQIQLPRQIKLRNKNFLLKESPRRIFFPVIIKPNLPDSDNFFFGGKFSKFIASRFVEVVNFFRVNADIFFRSTLLMLANLFLVSVGARSGDLILAANSLIHQLNGLFAYFVDGIAFAGEALVGKYVGRRDVAQLRLCVRRLFLWAAALTVVFTVLYAFPQLFFVMLTDDAVVREVAMQYRWWCALLPVCGAAAFVWDGVFIGLTYSRGMLWAVAIADLFFIGLYFILPASMGNHRLWLAFVIYLAMRGVVQTALYRRKKLLLAT